MNPERHFLDWDTPATIKVRNFLLPEQLSGPVELASDLVVVPTRQAGRRLRETLARQCSIQKTVLLSLRIVTPSYFLQPEDSFGSIASPLDTAATWAEILSNIDPELYSGLLPSYVPVQDFLWALHTGDILQRLRRTLADGGYSIATVYNDFGDILEEMERWRNLAELEDVYLERLTAVGLKDHIAEMLRQVESPQSPKGIERIVIAAVPDPTPLMVQKLEKISSCNIPITVLVHAPDSLSDCFDKWGRPLPEKWRERPISIPGPDDNIFLSGSPRLQSRKVIELMAQEKGHFGPDDIAIGVPDSEVVPFLETELADESLSPFDPSGKPAEQHPLSLFLRNYRDLLSNGDYAALSAFLRNRDFLDYLERRHHIPPDRLLREVDNYQNKHLPQTLENIFGDLSEGRVSEIGEDEFPTLAKAINFLAEHIQEITQTDAVRPLRSFLQKIYEFRIISSGKAEDNDFATVAELIDEALHMISESPLKQMNLKVKDTLDLLLWYLSGKLYFPEPAEEAVVDLEGWMELSWNDAPFLIVTGMNDGLVPAGRVEDIFLPDTLRRQLNLPDQEMHLAVYSYQMTALIESRRAQGRICFIAGKTASGGDTLKPSRLLLRCKDSELPGRALRLFGSPPEPPENYPSDVSFLLEASPPPDVPGYKLEIKRIPVTAFREYLTCPFRFYLKRVLEMEAIDDLKTELNARDFGSLVHDVLYAMACDEEMRQCNKVNRLQDFLDARTADWIKARLGPLPPLQVEVQMESATQRLRYAAEMQVNLIEEGWEIVGWERAIQGYIDGMLVRGKIDRIDRNRQTGSIRVLDYKTSENTTSPEEAHFGSLSKDQEYNDYVKIETNGRLRRWTDLQLPLYAMLLSFENEVDKQYEVGYFNLPRSAKDSGVVLWEAFSPELLESSERCARGVISDIRNRRFWPPAVRLRYDDFESLFSSDPALCVNTESFQRFMNRGKLL